MNNPYAAPAAVLDDVPAAEDTYQAKLFQLDGRIGRLRYIAYSWLISIPYTVVMLMLTSWALQGTLSLLQNVLLAVPYAFIARRRLQDLDKSPWFALLMLIPLVNVIPGLWLMFAPGTDGPNRYGPPEHKSAGVIAVVGVFLGIILLGIFSAIAIPAYQSYLQKAQAAQQARSR